MAKYTYLKPKFMKLYLSGDVKTLTQFAISEGIDPKNGVFKKDTTGWKTEAENKIKIVAEKAEEKAIERVAKRKALEYESIFDNLGAVALGMTEFLKQWAESIDKVVKDTENGAGVEELEALFKIDPRRAKAILESGLLAHDLLKKIYTGDDLPLTADLKHEIEKAKQIKGTGSDNPEDKQSVEDRIAEKMKQNGFIN